MTNVCYTTIGIAQSQDEMDKHLAKVDQSALGSGWTAGDIMYADLDILGGRLPQIPMFSCGW